MKCSNCGMADLVHDVRDMPYTYKGEATVFAQVAGGIAPHAEKACLMSQRRAGLARR
jgi:HTH-type transcriptional regulator / antitoxin MqsA